MTRLIMPVHAFRYVARRPPFPQHRTRLAGAEGVPGWVSAALTVGLACAFFDEVVRKAVPGQPVQVTAVKDGLFFLACLASAKEVAWPSWLRVFFPWAVYVSVSSMAPLAAAGNLLHCVACLKTYLGFILLFAAGVSASQSTRLVGRLGGLFLAGTAVAAIVGLLQQLAPQALPQILLVRGYIEKHSLAGGDYSESLLSSPSIFAQTLLLASLLSFDRWCRTGKPLSLVLLALFAAGMWASHIRVAPALLLLGFVILYTLSAIRERSLWNAHSRGTILAFLVGGCVGIVALATGLQRASTLVDERTASRDYRFYGGLLNLEDIQRRVMLPFREASHVRPEELLLGYGAGTGGSLRRFLSSEAAAAVPQVHDSGVALLVREMGLVGAALFFVPVTWNLLICTWRLTTGRSSVALALLAAVWVFTIWFAIKSHAVIANSFSQAMWFGGFGVTYGIAMSRTQADRRR